MPRKPGKISKPAKVTYAAMKLSPEEKARLKALCDEQGITLTWAMYEGSRLYLEELKAARERGEDPLGIWTVE